MMSLVSVLSRGVVQSGKARDWAVLRTVRDKWDKLFYNTMIIEEYSDIAHIYA
jgi:hypothetical protein